VDASREAVYSDITLNLRLITMFSMLPRGYTGYAGFPERSSRKPITSYSALSVIPCALHKLAPSSGRDVHDDADSVSHSVKEMRLLLKIVFD